MSQKQEPSTSAALPVVLVQPPPPLKLSRVLEKTSFTDEIHFAPAGIGGLFNYLQSFIHPNWCRILSIHSRVNDLFQACCHPLSTDKRHETKGYESGVLDPGVTWVAQKVTLPHVLGVTPRFSETILSMEGGLKLLPMTHSSKGAQKPDC